nr:hypothetical protein [Pandoravirus belohorizontensis]
MGRRRRRRHRQPSFFCASAKVCARPPFTDDETPCRPAISDRAIEPVDREIFQAVAVNPDALDVDACWPTDPDAMMRSHYPADRWPAGGRRPASDTSAEDPRRCVHYAIAGGTDGARARALDKAVRLLGSRLTLPYAAVKGCVHGSDRDTAVGRTILAHVPPSCLHDGSKDTAAGRARRSQAFRGTGEVRCLFLAYATAHCRRTPTRLLTEALGPGAHRFFDMVIVYGDGVDVARIAHRAVHCVVLLPCPLGSTYGAPFEDMVAAVDAGGTARSLLARGRAAIRLWPQGAGPWDDLRVEPPRVCVPPRDQFHAHLAWRAHYVLARTGGRLLRSAQERARGRHGVPSLLASSARVCARHLDDIDVDVIPDDCLDMILCAAAVAWVDLSAAATSEADARTCSALLAMRRFVGRRETRCWLSPTRSTVDFVSAALQRGHLTTTAALPEPKKENA